MTEHLEIYDARELGILTNPKTYDKIESLILFSVDLTSFPREICQMSNLKSLSVIASQLQNLPKEIGQLKSLKELQLQFTQIENLPKEIGQLKSLERLLLSNKLTRLPAEIGQLSNLEYLYVESYELENLPKEIGQLKSLKQLHLEYTNFDLPKEIGHLKTFVIWLWLKDPHQKIKVPTSLKKFLTRRIGRYPEEFEFIPEKVINPKTNRYISVGKSTYNKLVDEGLIWEPV